MPSRAWAIGTLARLALGQLRDEEPPRRGWRWLADPRSAVLLTLATVVIVGGGRKLLQARRARGSVERLSEADVTPDDIRAVAQHGRTGLMELFEILSTSDKAPLREAAGQALAVIWKADDLIAEEEKALVRRGFQVDWRARRRYPRGLKSPILVSVKYGVPFLVGGDGIGPENLEWSHRILGTERAALEQFTPWKAGPGLAEFAIDPGDFPANGPHRLAFHARVRTKGLTETWEVDLPQIPFNFEFDPILAVDALLTMPDDARAEAIARAFRLEPVEPPESGSVYLNLNDDFALRDPPRLAISTPLPCDLAHALAIEFEGVPGRFPAGELVLSGQDPKSTPESTLRFDLGPIAPLPTEAIERPGVFRMRAVLTADPDRGWADPDVRSMWPGAILTDWTEVRIVRR